jgi:hypothetical protein
VREETPESKSTLVAKMNDLIEFAGLFGIIVKVKFIYPKPARAKRISKAAGQHKFLREMNEFAREVMAEE